MEIKFNSKDLLNCDEIEKLIISVRPIEKAQIISSKLLNYLLISNGDFYRFDVDNVLYIKENNDDDYMLTLISFFIDESYRTLSSEKQEILQLKYKKSYDSIFLNSNINKYLPQLRTYLTNNKISFSDQHSNQIHFKNGFWNFETNTFEKRIIGKHYINYHIKRDFVKPDSKAIDKVYKDINKIYPNKDDKDYLLMTYGIALTGQACADQTILFLIGKGSGGKSTIIELIKLSIEDYVLTLPKQTFSKGYSKIDKVLNTYLTKPFIKISYINEPEDTKMDETLFKDHIDGNIQTTSLYKDGSNDFKHHSKMVMAMNTTANIKIDSGTTRRTDAFTHSSKFTKDANEVDESKNIYLANLNFLSDCVKDETYLNAFFYILSQYGYNWLSKKEVFKQTENFKNTKDIIITSNDIIQDFMDKCLVITNKDSDRIGRDDMHELFKSNFSKSLITPTQLLSSLKQKDIDYKTDYRNPATGLKGCFVGVKVKDDDIPMDGPVDYKKLYMESQQRLKELEEKFELEKQQLQKDKFVSLVTPIKPQYDFKTIAKQTKKKIKAIKKKIDSVVTPTFEPEESDDELAFDDNTNLLLLVDQSEISTLPKLPKGVKNMEDFLVDFDDIDDSTF